MEMKKMPLEHEVKEDEEEHRWRPVSPFGVYFHSQSIQLSVIAVLEIEQPINILHSDMVSLVHALLLPLHPRFSSIIVTGKDGEQRWKKVEISVKDHIRTAVFPAGKSPEYYEKCLQDYLSKLSAEQFPETHPLWEIHFFKYPTTTAAGHLIFKIHHAIGDGYSLMAALLSCFKRSDDPSLPLTFPNNRIRRQDDDVEGGGGWRRTKTAAVFSRVLSAAVNTTSDMWLSFSKAKVAADGISPIRSGEIGVGYRPISAATITFSLDQIKEMKSRLGVTVNDIVTSIVFLGTRMYMQKVKPGSEDADTTAIVLLNTRMLRSYNSVKDMMKPDTESPWGNRFAFLHITLPKLIVPRDSAESWTATMRRRSIEFLNASRTIIRNKRSSIAVHLNAKLLDIYWRLKGSEAAATYVYLAVKNTSMAITNMIGPTEKMTLADHDVKGMYFLIAGNPQNVTVTMVSYMGQMRVTVGAEKGFIDPNKLKSCIQAAFDLLLDSTN